MSWASEIRRQYFWTEEQKQDKSHVFGTTRMNTKEDVEATRKISDALKKQVSIEEFKKLMEEL